MPAFATTAQSTQTPLVDLWAADSRRFWVQRADGRPIDTARTAALPDIAVSLPGGTTWQGATYGQPVQQVPLGAPRTPVLDDRKGFWDVVTGRADVPMPLPPVIRREADPTVPFDKHWRAVEGTSFLWEAWVLRAKAWPFVGFACSDWACWRLDMPWDAPGQPMGVVAAKIPHTVLILGVEQVATRALDHVGFLGLPDYSSAPPVGPARGTDGSLANHPCRAGERLVLSPVALARISDTHGPGSPAANLAAGLARFGVVVGDKTGSVAAITMTQDTRWPQLLGGLSLRLRDFLVVQAP